MGTVRVRTIVEFSYLIDDVGFSGTQIAETALVDPVGSAIDAYLDPEEETDKYEVIYQTVTIEDETHLTNGDILDMGEVTFLNCGHAEYEQSRCVVKDCKNYIGLLTHKTYGRQDAHKVRCPFCKSQVLLLGNGLLERHSPEGQPFWSKGCMGSGSKYEIPRKP